MHNDIKENQMPLKAMSYKIIHRQHTFAICTAIILQYEKVNKLDRSLVFNCQSEHEWAEHEWSHQESIRYLDRPNSRGTITVVHVTWGAVVTVKVTSTVVKSR